MLLRLHRSEERDYKVIEKIKKDLMTTLKRKGINIGNVEIAVNSGCVNIEVFMKKNNGR